MRLKCFFLQCLEGGDCEDNVQLSGVNVSEILVFYQNFLPFCPKQIVQPCLFQCTRNTAYGSGDVGLSSLLTIFVVKDGDNGNDGENHDNGDVQIISRMLMMVVVIMVTFVKQQ